MKRIDRKMDCESRHLFRLHANGSELQPLASPHVLVHGSASDIGSVPRNSVDLIVTSPPYNVGKDYGEESDDLIPYDEYLRFSRKWLKNCWHWAKDTGRLCVNVGLDTSSAGKRPLASDLTQAALEERWNYQTTILWMEGNVSKATAWGSWKSASAPNVICPAEVVLVFGKGDWKRSKGGQSDITGEEFLDWVRGMWKFGGENRKPCGHAAAFPPELPERCIKLFSFLGDTVLDPFGGSGTTMLVAAKARKGCLGNRTGGGLRPSVNAPNREAMRLGIRRGIRKGKMGGLVISK